MNRNTEQHFATNPTIEIGRSKFDRGHTVKTSFNTGDLIPIYVDCTIMPGDTVKMRMSEVVRMMTPLVPVMDNAFMDTYFFFVPTRLIWNHWREFMGENRTEPWIQNTQYEVPQIIAPENGWKKGSLADYMGYPTEIGSYKASALPFRAYGLIWNEWFRDENLKNPVYISDGETDLQGTDGTTLGANYDYVIDTEKGAFPCKAAKIHDYFTSCLPGAQKGPAVQIPLGDTAPVVGKKGINNETWDEDLVGKELYFSKGTGTAVNMYADNTNPAEVLSNNSSISLGVDLSKAVGATVNQLRQAFAVQKYYENQALGGTRYIEQIKAHFGVTNPDFRMQRPEYLGGERIPINMNQVVTTYEVSGADPVGTTGAYSVTNNINEDLFTHSFTEHGILMGLAVVRTTHTYQQGLNRQFSKKKVVDFYTPEFAHLGNMAVLNKELYLQGTDKDEEAFGYQEAWASERFFPDIITGELRSNYSQSLDAWHYADDYNALPTLGSEWIDETTENVARTLAVQNHDQLFGDFYFGAVYTRPMPLFSVPGLIDHM